MFKKKNGYYEITRFKNCSLGAYYTTRELLKDSRELWGNHELRGKIKEFFKIEDKKMVFAKQTHSTNIAVLRDEIQDIYEDTDGFVTKRKDLVLFTQYADCLPIYAYDPVNDVIGLVHAGWKGAFDGIQKKLIETMVREYNSKPKHIIIGLGVGITQEDYQVEADFFENYLAKFGKDLTYQVFSIKENRYHYDNILFNKIQLIESGVLEENISFSILSTSRSEFHSFRRDQERSGRNGAFLFFKPCQFN